MVYEARAGQTFLLGATAWRIEEIGRDRVIVTPAPGASGAVPFWHGDGVGRPTELGEAIGAFSRWAVDQPRRGARARLRPRRARGAQPARVPGRAARRRPASLPSDRTIVSSASATRSATGACACSHRSAGASMPPGRSRCRARIRERFGLEADAIWSDDGIIVHLPDTDEPPSAELLMPEPERDRGAGRRRARLLGAVRRALPRERRAGAADPARLPGQAHPALAAAPQVADAARGRAPLPGLPGHPRDLPRVPARRARPAGSRGAAARARDARDLARRGRDADRLAVCRRRCCSTTSPPTCTRATRRMPSGAPPALSLDRELLRELLGQEELRELIDPGALDGARSRPPAPLARAPGDLARRAPRRAARRSAR